MAGFCRQRSSVDRASRAVLHHRDRHARAHLRLARPGHSLQTAPAYLIGTALPLSAAGEARGDALRDHATLVAMRAIFHAGRDAEVQHRPEVSGLVRLVGLIVARLVLRRIYIYTNVLLILSYTRLLREIAPASYRDYA